jgi:formamidase
MALDLIRDVRIAGCTVGPSLPMVGPVRDGGTIVARTAPGCWGPMITPHLDGGHEITEPVAVGGAEIGDAIAIRIRRITVCSRATASGTGTPVEGTRLRRGTQVIKKCPRCNAEFPATVVEGFGKGAIKCRSCGAEAIPYRVTSGYTMVFDDQETYGITVGREKAAEIAERAREYAALPASSEQHPVLSLAVADLRGGILARVRPFIGNIGTVPAIDVSASGNCGDFGQSLREDGLAPEELDALTDGHLDADSVRAGAILICPVKVRGGGVYLGDVHAMQGDGEIAGHTTDVSAEVELKVNVVKGLSMQGPILLPPVEDLPFLCQPFSKLELEQGRELALAWGAELEEVAPIQVVGSGPDLNAAVQNALERMALLLDMSLDEVRNRVTINGALEIGRAPGLVLASVMAPVEKLDRLGILPLVRDQYGLQDRPPGSSKTSDCKSDTMDGLKGLKGESYA